MICEVCKRTECVEPWTICPSCWRSRVECDRAIPKIGASLRRENYFIKGKTTPTTQGHASIHERRGRKLIRPLQEYSFGAYEDYEESE